MSDLSIYKPDVTVWINNEKSKLNDKINYINDQYSRVLASEYSELFSTYIKNDVLNFPNDDVNCLIRIGNYKDALIGQQNLILTFYNSITP